jgi:hypothetical protein
MKPPVLIYPKKSADVKTAAIGKIHKKILDKKLDKIVI